jgi:nicotinamide-nucleotide adenylyltransferase
MVITDANDQYGMVRGIYIGRFQPYHNGHHKMVEKISGEVDEMVLGIGSAGDSHTRKNPFTAGERVLMVTRAIEEFDIPSYVVQIEDLKRNSIWVSHVESISPRFDVAYSNNPLVIQLFKEAEKEIRQVPMFDRDVLEGAEVRRRMENGEDWQALVPIPVKKIIEEIGGIERIQRINESDSER